MREQRGGGRKVVCDFRRLDAKAAASDVSKERPGWVMSGRPLLVLLQLLLAGWPPLQLRQHAGALQVGWRGKEGTEG